MGARCGFGTVDNPAGCGGVTGSGEGGAGVAVRVAMFAGAVEDALISTLVVDGIAIVTGGAAGGAGVMVTWAG